MLTSCLKGLSSDKKGFTLLELIVVMFLMTLILGMSSVFFMNTLPGGKLNAAARELTATLRHAKALAQMNGEQQTVTINLDEKKYSLTDRGGKQIPADLNIRVIDPLSGDQTSGTYQIVFPATGGAEGGTVILWNSKKSITLNIDPVAGVVVTK